MLLSVPLFVPLSVLILAHAITQPARAQTDGGMRNPPLSVVTLLQYERMLGFPLTPEVAACMSGELQAQWFLPNKASMMLPTSRVDVVRIANERCQSTLNPRAVNDQPRLGEHLQKRFQQQLAAAQALESAMAHGRHCLETARDAQSLNDCLSKPNGKSTLEFSEEDRKKWLILFEREYQGKGR